MASAGDEGQGDKKTAPVAGPARVAAQPAGVESTGTAPGVGSPGQVGVTSPGTVGASIGPIGGTNAAADIPSDGSGIAQGMTGPAGAPKNPSQLGLDENPDDLGQEGMQSTLKPNTTHGDKPQDRY